MVLPVRKVWYNVSKRFGIRKTDTKYIIGTTEVKLREVAGIVKLHRDVRSCENEDVHVLWELLKQNESGRIRSSDSAAAAAAAGRKKANSWKVFDWARHAPFCCCCCSA